MEKEKIPYYLGLDMGSSSVGWALTDTEYKVIRLKGKDAWGVRLFAEANSAQDRRQHRCSRRNKQRQQQRLKELTRMFRSEVEKVDPNFFYRLEDNKFVLEDKKVQEHFTLFNDSNYTDKDFYDQYPTISHLNLDLLTKDEKFDIRLLFLAIHQKFKHRGHFLNKGLMAEQSDTLHDLLAELDDNLQNVELPAIFESYEEVIQATLSDQSLTPSKRLDILKTQMGVKKDKQIVEMLKLICGTKGTWITLFPADKQAEDNKIKISFKDSPLEEIAAELDGFADEAELQVISSLHAIYDWALLQKIMLDPDTKQPFQYLSEARVASYEKHKKELKELKALIKKEAPDQYRSFFREMSDKNYSGYIGSTINKKQRIRTKKTKEEDFYKALKKLLQSIPESEKKSEILAKIDLGQYLQKQTGTANSVIPMQLQLKELQKILENQEKYYPFLLEKDESGLTISQRIIELFKFQLPYYIGPTRNLNGEGNGWIVRNPGQETTKIYPWNLTEVVNEKETANQFIQRLIRSCTYLSNEKVLPAESLLYQVFKVLNELNNVKVNGIKLDEIRHGLRQEIYKNLFASGNTVTIKQVQNYLKKQGIVSDQESITITGIDNKFSNSLSSWKKFYQIFEKNDFSQKDLRMIENIIEWSTVYGDSKHFLKEKIKEAYPQITPKQLKKILSLSFKDWGRLSRKFLMLPGGVDEAGNPVLLIQAMWENDRNLMQLLSADSPYTNTLASLEKNISKEIHELSINDLDDLYLSAPVKRMIWQTLKIVKELIDTMGYPPEKIFFEMARGDEKEKKRTESRKSQLAAAYKNIKLPEFKECKNKLETLEENVFRRNTIYLYFQQNGRCMYTGQPIDLDVLLKQTKENRVYDIDHIYPRSKVKDDSILSNKVLVLRKANASKSNTYPIDPLIQKRQKGFWNSLLKNGLITQEKFNRLMRTTPFTQEELYGFVNRQLVETRQGTKAVTQILKNTFPQSNQPDFVYVKAGNVSDFRQKFNIPKCRSVNNLHHAYDAYLNIVVGNVYDTKFKKFFKSGKFNPDDEKYHMDKVFDFTVKSGDQIAWNPVKSKSLQVVKKMVSKQTPLVTRRSFEQKGAISKIELTVAKKCKPGSYLPAKTHDKRVANVEVYGGYDSITTAYFFIVEHTLKKKRTLSFEFVPILLSKAISTPEKLVDYCKNGLHLIDPVIKVPKIPIYSLLRIDGFNYYLTGRTNDSLILTNAIELKLNPEFEKIVWQIDQAQKKQIPLDTIDDFKTKVEKLYDELTSKHAKGIFSLRRNSIGDKLVAGRDKFVELGSDEQAQLISEVLKLSSTNIKTVGNLETIGFAKNTGGLSISKRYTSENYKEFKLINQSPTGLFESTVNLLEL